MTIMAFNAENLFDTEDDPDNIGDDTYLPLAVKQSDPDHEANCRANNNSAFYIRQCIELDWSEAVLETRLNALADVLTAASPRPDIVIMPETENLAVIELLNNTLPESERYETLIQLDTTSVTEDRGIDVAILSRLALAAPAAAHRINFGSDARLCGGTRDIVEAPLSLPDGKVLYVFGVHFPSGGNPMICRQRTCESASERDPMCRRDFIGLRRRSAFGPHADSQLVLFLVPVFYVIFADLRPPRPLFETERQHQPAPT